MVTSSSYHRDVSWLLNRSKEESSRLEPKIRAAISIAWPDCCQISRKFLRQGEPQQELWEQAIVRLHHDLEQNPTLTDSTAAQVLAKHYGLYSRQAAARRKSDARRFVELREISDDKDIESVVHANVDLATVLESMDPDVREIVVLRHLRGQSWRQVAERKGISDVAVRKRCAKAMSKLREQFRWRTNPNNR